MLRKIVHIDEEKCDGCGLCADACAEGAIAVIHGKARLVNESYCDGLGACLRECPRGAITIIEREAAAFDEMAAAHERFEARSADKSLPGRASLFTPRASLPADGESRGAHGSGVFAEEEAVHVPDSLPCGCPETMVRDLGKNPRGAEPAERRKTGVVRRLRNWPIQLRLVPITAPYLRGARLLLAADCTAFAFPGFHSELLEDKLLLVGCPKLDDASFYREKLASVIAENQVREITVVHMEVPCCFGLLSLARRAVEDAGTATRITAVRLGVNGEVLAREDAVGAAPERSAGEDTSSCQRV